MPSIRFAATFLAAALPFCVAQTYTTCNPLSSTCPADKGLASSSLFTDFTKGASNDWTVSAGSITYGPNGAEFVVNKEGDSPTIETDFYFFFGTAEVKMQSAPGTGIVSSIVLESDDLDEVDWEALGGDNTQIETNYFGKGNTATYDRATYVPVSSPETTFHTYTVNWTPQSIQWLIDGNVIRTLTAAEASNGQYFPQTPMRLRLGIWAGGDPKNPEGTIEWAGGVTNFGDAPFKMYVQSVKITNDNPASQYLYGDNSGSWNSIKLIGGSGTSASSGSSDPATTSTVSASGSSSSSASRTISTFVSSSSATSTSVPATGNSTAGINPISGLSPAGNSSSNSTSPSSSSGSSASSSSAAGSTSTNKTSDALAQAQFSGSLFALYGFVFAVVGVVF